MPDGAYELALALVSRLARSLRITRMAIAEKPCSGTAADGMETIGVEDTGEMKRAGLGHATAHDIA